VFLHQHGQQHDLKWEEMGGVGGGRQMMPSGSEEIVQSALVLSAKCATESSERGLLLQEGLGNRRKSASHQTRIHRNRAGAACPAVTVTVME
jgi:hypothetical protein